VLDGAFAYQASALSARHTVAQVTWSNPADGFRPAIEWVEDPEGLARWGVRPVEIAALGTTSGGSAAGCSTPRRRRPRR
jgi:predicted phage tail protein